MEDTEGRELPQRHREHGVRILKKVFNPFSGSRFPSSGSELRALCVFVVIPSPPCPPSPLCDLTLLACSRFSALLVWAFPLLISLPPEASRSGPSVRLQASPPHFLTVAPSVFLPGDSGDQSTSSAVQFWAVLGRFD